MINRDTLKAALDAGIITELQASSLEKLSISRQEARSNLSVVDEPFEIFRGFNEIFIVVGLGILAMGWYVLIAVVANFNNIPTLCLFSAIPIWLLSEYFIRQRRMLAPAIALALLFSANAASGFVAQFAQVFMIAQQDYSSLLLPFGLTIISLTIFWWRFAVPFSMMLIALSIFSFALLLTVVQTDVPLTTTNLFHLSGRGPFAWVTIIFGAFSFIAAMWFDMSDPHRVTRRSAQGFWLHLVAAPALVNPIALSLIEQDTFVSNVTLLIVLLLFSIIAVIINRRSFLIAAASYCVALCFVVFDNASTGLILLSLGTLLVVFGAAWERIRSRVLALFGPILPLDRLPPST
ncbi:MAG: hypothetical protein OXC68_09830 [Aestuariivita sp.]|nr:hypothetical protein [Aestuariivita sp.]